MARNSSGQHEAGPNRNSSTDEPSGAQNGSQQQTSTNGSEPRRAGIFLSKQTLDAILKHKSQRGADMIALLTFYHYTALWQGTNQPKADVRYVIKGLHWGHDKVREIRALLLELKLIEDVRRVDQRTGKVTGWFTKLAFFRPVPEPIAPMKNHPPDLPEGGFRERNALRSGNLNALRSGKEVFSNENTKVFAAAKPVSLASLLSSLPERQVRVAELFVQYLSERFPRRLMPITERTEALETALAQAAATEKEVKDFERLCRDVAWVCANPHFHGRGGRYNFTDRYGQHDFVVPNPQRKNRGRNSIMDLIWANCHP
jgi:hypothetical protein